jgi:probable HAF family extracellular repeat protein
MSKISFGMWAAMALVLVPLAGAQSYSVTDLGALAGSTYCAVSALNDHGSVVGSCIVPGYNDHAYLWTPATGMQDLGTLPGDTSSVPSAINNLGEVVGTSYSSSAVAHAFIWTAGAGMKRVGPGGVSSGAAGINDDGEVAGTFYIDGIVVYHAFVVRKDGTSETSGRWEVPLAVLRQ